MTELTAFYHSLERTITVYCVPFGFILFISAVYIERISILYEALLNMYCSYSYFVMKINC